MGQEFAKDALPRFETGFLPIGMVFAGARLHEGVLDAPPEAAIGVAGADIDRVGRNGRTRMGMAHEARRDPSAADISRLRRIEHDTAAFDITWLWSSVMWNGTPRFATSAATRSTRPKCSDHMFTWTSKQGITSCRMPNS
jgi:hypothetical protein